MPPLRRSWPGLDVDDLKVVLAVLGLLWAFLSSVVVWAFATGKFAGSQGALEERLRREIGDAKREAIHDAVGRVTRQVVELNEEKVDKELHDEQIGELKRRVSYCERKLTIGNGSVGV